MSSVIDNLSLPLLSQSAIVNQTPEYALKISDWNRQSLVVVKELDGTFLREDPNALSPNSLANTFAIAASLSGEEEWMNEELHLMAKSILSRLPQPTLEIVISILTRHVRPCFMKNPHSRINSESGRKLPQPTSGDNALYEDQAWKNYPWIGTLLLWCIRHIKSADYEVAWHLIIPPTMTLLDDYEVHSKIQGVHIVSQMLKNVPSQLLKRTGIDGLLNSSLKGSLLHLHTGLTPSLVRASIPAFIELTKITTLVGSKTRFDQLCAILGDSILGGIWIYAFNDYETIEASMTALPPLLEELGIGTVRYLKVLVSQIIHNITALPIQDTSFSMQVASVELLDVVIRICRPRMSHWSNFITDGIARCWISLSETSMLTDKGELRQALRQVSKTLRECCPSVVEKEYKQILSCDEVMFKELLSVDIAQRQETRRQRRHFS